MKTTYVVILTVLLLLVSACAQKVNDPADVQAIKKSMDDFPKAVNAADANGVVALMTDKAIFADLSAPVAVGKDAIRSHFQSFFDHFKPDLSTSVEDVRVTGDLAVARGAFTNKVTPKAEGVAPVSYSGSWVVALARQNDGSWKWDWVVGNSDQPAPGSTASGEDEQALYQIERDMAEALLKKDAAAMDKMLANEFVANFDGRTQNKKQFLAAMKANPAKVESAANSDMKAMVFGDTAVVHGMYVEKSTLNGKDMSATYRYTDIFAKRNGRWQCVGGHANKVQ